MTCTVFQLDPFQGTMRPLLRSIALTFLMTGLAMAQERPGSIGSGYVQGGITLDHQRGVSGETDQLYVAAPGGTTLGWIVLGGVFIGAGLSIEGELASTGVMSAREPSRYGMTFNEDRRDRFFGVNMRFHVPANRSVHLEPLAGLAFVQHQRWSQTEYFQYWLTPQQQTIVGPRVRDDLPARLGLTAGLDVRVGGRHMAVVPSFRFRMAEIGEDIVSAYPGGLPRWTISAGVAARVDF